MIMQSGSIVHSLVCADHAGLKGLSIRNRLDRVDFIICGLMLNIRDGARLICG